MWEGLVSAGKKCTETRKRGQNPPKKLLRNTVKGRGQNFLPEPKKPGGVRSIKLERIVSVKSHGFRFTGFLFVNLQFETFLHTSCPKSFLVDYFQRNTDTLKARLCVINRCVGAGFTVAASRRFKSAALLLLPPGKSQTVDPFISSDSTRIVLMLPSVKNFVFLRSS